MGSPQPLNLLLTQPSSGLGPNTWAKGLRGSGQSLLAWGNRGPGATEGPGPQPHGAHPSLPGPVGDPGTRTQGPVCAAAWQALGALPDASRSRSESLTLSELPTASLSTVPRKATDHSPQDRSPRHLFSASPKQESESKNKNIWLRRATQGARRAPPGEGGTPQTERLPTQPGS